MDTVLHSCGIADCVASAYGGRNRKCAAKFATWLLKENENKNAMGRFRDQSEIEMKSGSGSGLDDLSDGLIYEVLSCYAIIFTPHLLYFAKVKHIHLTFQVLY